jgi:hypothetical protein
VPPALASRLRLRQRWAPMRVFLDFEASSLGRHSYPIEVAWVFEDGRGEAHLIRPAPDWTDWAVEAEAIHGIDRDTLAAEGRPVAEVARRMIDALTGHDLHASAPSWDGKWLSTLLRAAGLPRHALRLSDTELARAAAATEALRGRVPDTELAAQVAAVMADVAQWLAKQPVRHRALADAEQERQAWIEARRRAAELVGGA